VFMPKKKKVMEGLKVMEEETSSTPIKKHACQFAKCTKHKLMI